MKRLRGITWNHTRGLVPLQATAQRYAEKNPGVEIAWEKRSLKDFEEFPIQKLAETYDFLIIDHPFTGYAAKHGTLLALDQHLSPAFLEEQAAQSVGASHATYSLAGHQWALAIDAATPVAMWRPDLLERHRLRVPQTWNEVLDLAKRGMVELPAAPINCLMNFYMLCAAFGEEPFLSLDRVISTAPGIDALEALDHLIQYCAPGCLERNPIQSCELMARRDESQLAYCPFAYGYSNYAREGYAESSLMFGDIPQAPTSAPLRSTLGGTGLAISARTTELETCVHYAEFIASGEIQRTLYTRSGGQPGHRTAWLDEENNRLTRDYFRNTLATLDRAYVRPRYCGYLEFQEQAGHVLHGYFIKKQDAKETLRRLDTLYIDSLQHA